MQTPVESSKTPSTAIPTAAITWSVDSCATRLAIAAMVFSPLGSSFGVGVVSVLMIEKFSSTKALFISVPPISTAATYLTEKSVITYRE